MSLVLIADDEMPTLEILAQVAEDLGYQVLEAHDGEEALTLARAHQPGLVLTDFMMPRMSGVALMRAIRADPQLSSTPVVLMSAAQPEAWGEATAFLAKPLGLDRVESVLTRLLPLGASSPAVRDIRPSKGPPTGQHPNEMLNWIAHELKTPLGAARVSAELLQRQLGARRDEREGRHVTMILRQVDRMTTIITSMLDAASLDAGKMVLHRESVDLVRFVESTVAAWRELRPAADLTLALPDGALEISVDPERLRQVLDNLLSNAIKYAGQSRIEVCVESAIRSASVIVRDHGPGIPAADIPHLFERFRRVEGNQASTGHGLGLYIASAVARLHGGGLSVKSVLGRGTTFTVSLPTMH
jgi:two-component system sensor histidine kinase/response regulator